MGKIRSLRADEIECRVGTISGKGLSLLLYKDARVDQSLLDECYGIMGWQRKHEKIGDAIYCTVSVRDEKTGEWVSKQDVGTESYSDAVKGAASDSFKRACFNFGIGRELYTAPFIWIPAEKADIRSEGNRYITKEHFSVSHIAYAENKITELEIVNRRKAVVYTYHAGNSKEDNQKSDSRKEEKKTKALTVQQKKKLREEMARTGVTEDEIKARYRVEDLLSMPKEIYDKVMSALDKTKDMAA